MKVESGLFLRQIAAPLNMLSLAVTIKTSCKTEEANFFSQLMYWGKHKQGVDLASHRWILLFFVGPSSHESSCRNMSLFLGPPSSSTMQCWFASNKGWKLHVCVGNSFILSSLNNFPGCFFLVISLCVFVFKTQAMTECCRFDHCILFPYAFRLKLKTRNLHKKQEIQIFGTRSSSRWVLTSVRTFRMTIRTLFNFVIRS